MVMNYKRIKIYFITLCMGAVGMSCQDARESGFVVGERLFDTGWKFRKGEIQQAEQIDFDDSDWREPTIPHDWSIEPQAIRDDEHIGPFVKGVKDSTSTGNIIGGTGWYRKHFTLSRTDAGKTIILYFDGVSVQSDIWINGQHAGFHPNGYTPFYYNLTPWLKAAGEENVIAVKTVHTGDNSRWYPGAGLYRHVTLLVGGAVYIEPWGVCVTTPEVNPEQSPVNVAVSVRNDTEADSKVMIHATLFDPRGQISGSSEYSGLCLSGQQINPALSFNVVHPQLWSPDSPSLYTAEVTVTADGKPSDVKRVKFGIRSVSFSAKTGFLLNGKETLLNGACIHHDNGLLGSATFDRAEFRRVELLKKNGFNAIRTSHNLPSAQFLHACDSIGMLVIDEVFDMWIHPKRDNDYHLYFNEWSERDVSAMALRDRNHPSVILWSIGNEIYERADSSGLAIAERLIATVKSLDNTRPVSQAICALWQVPSQKWDATAPAFALLDAGCYNYEWKHYEEDHRLYPDRVMIGTESFPREARINRQMAVEKPYVVGDFVWTGMDYIGEVGIGNTRYGEAGERAVPVRPWPWYLSWCGDIDICGNKKPQSYYRNVVWEQSDLEILVHSPVPKGKTELVSLWGWPDEYPHWNWAGNENTPLRISVYTQYDTVRLHLNDEFVGEKAVTSSTYTAVFTVPYQAGKLTAAGVKDGKEVGSKSLITSGKASGIRLVAEHPSVHADPNDLAYVRIEVTDDIGRLVPDAEVMIQLSVTGDGELIACGNAAPDDLESFRNPDCKTFRGRALAILQPGNHSGSMSLTVKSGQLPEAKVEIHIK
jgi:beta-galactosidase